MTSSRHPRCQIGPEIESNEVINGCWSESVAGDVPTQAEPTKRISSSLQFPTKSLDAHQILGNGCGPSSAGFQFQNCQPWNPVNLYICRGGPNVGSSSQQQDGKQVWNELQNHGTKQVTFSTLMVQQVLLVGRRHSEGSPQVAAIDNVNNIFYVSTKGTVLKLVVSGRINQVSSFFVSGCYCRWKATEAVVAFHSSESPYSGRHLRTSQTKS